MNELLMWVVFPEQVFEAQYLQEDPVSRLLTFALVLFLNVCTSNNVQSASQVQFLEFQVHLHVNAVKIRAVSRSQIAINAAVYLG